MEPCCAIVRVPTYTFEELLLSHLSVLFFSTGVLPPRFTQPNSRVCTQIIFSNVIINLININAVKRFGRI